MQDAIPIALPPRRGGIQSIARAAGVLRALAQAPAGLALAELAETVRLPKSTVHRLVGALLAEELAAYAPDGRIVLGGGVARLGAAAAEAFVPRLHPMLESLSRRLGETVDLAVLDGTIVRFVDQVAGTHRLRAVSAVGAEFPAHCTANGKALLAGISDEAIRLLLPSRLPRLTANTITSRGALLEELARIRASGVAFDREEHTAGICAVGAAITGAAGTLAAVSVPTPAIRFEEHRSRYAQAVATVAREASSTLAYGR